MIHASVKYQARPSPALVLESASVIPSTYIDRILDLVSRETQMSQRY